MAEQLSSFNEFHKEINAKLVLEHVVHVYYEWMIDIVEDILFQFDILKLFIINDYVFSDAFHCVNLLSVNVLNQKHFSKGALPHHLHNDKILKHGHVRALLLASEYQISTLSHALPSSRLFHRPVWICIRLLLILFVIVIIVLVFVRKVFRLLKLHVSDFNILL